MRKLMYECEDVLTVRHLPMSATVVDEGELWFH